MRVAVITPVGPGHEESVKGCAASVAVAWSFSQGPFTSLQHCIVEDPKGELGAAGGRNRGRGRNSLTKGTFSGDSSPLPDSQS